MMLLCLANIGTSMANIFRFLYARVCCGYCNYVKRRHMRMRAAATLSSVAAVAQNPAGVSYAALASLNNQNNPPISANLSESIQNSNNLAQVVNEISTNVNNDSKSEHDPSSESKNLTINPNTLTINSTKSETNSNIIKLPLAIGSEKQPSITLVPSPTIFKAGPNEADLLDLFDDNNSVDYRKITVPISITLFLLSSYILLGGLLFTTWEGWSILDGVYFCFITLSTIGLGDLVPGNSINDSDTQAELKLVGCSLYLLMGLSLIAMCFNLMQEEVTAKFRRLAVRLGIIDDPSLW